MKRSQLPAAEIGLCYCNQLFRIERALKDLDAQERKARRLKLEGPVWDDFWKWLGTLKPLGGSKLEKAVNYAENHQELTRFVIKHRANSVLYRVLFHRKLALPSTNRLVLR